MKNKILKTLVRHNMIKKSDDVKRFLDTYPVDVMGKISDIFNEIVVLSGDVQINEKSLETIIHGKIENIKVDTVPASLEALYISISNKTVQSIVKSVDFSFDTVDSEAINSMQKNFYWIGQEYGDKLQAELKETMKRVFDGDTARIDIPALLQDNFKIVLGRDLRYFKGVSDHIILQSQNVSRVVQGKKYGVTHYKVRAQIDSRTSDVCRGMHGRIIEAKHLENITDKLFEAKSIGAKKGASAWSSKPNLGKLDSNFGLPPYHFRCRTEVLPVWLDSEDVGGVKVLNTKPTAKDELFRHIDRMGYERVAKEDIYKHSQSGDEKIEPKELVRAINKQDRLEHHSDEPNRTVALSGKDVIIYEGNKVWTVISRATEKSAKAYFLNWTKENLWKSENYKYSLIGRFQSFVRGGKMTVS